MCVANPKHTHYFENVYLIGRKPREFIAIAVVRLLSLVGFLHIQLNQKIQPLMVNVIKPQYTIYMEIQ